MSFADGEALPITQDALELRLQPAPTFTATSCPHCDNVFEVAIDFEEIKDHVEFERLKKKELESQKEAYKQEITRFQEEVNSLKETLANLCNQLAQAQVENLRSKQASLEQDNYIKQLKDHLKQSEEELHHLAHDFELALERNKELQAAHVRNTGVVAPVKYRSKTAMRISEGNPTVGPSTAGGPGDSTPSGVGGGVPTPGTTGGLGSRHPSKVQQLASRYDSVPSPPQKSAKDKDMYRTQLMHFYSVHNPAKMGEVDNILAEFEGHEEEMFVSLARKYGVPPILPLRGGSAGYPTHSVPRHAGGVDTDDDLRLVAPLTLQMAQAQRSPHY